MLVRLLSIVFSFAVLLGFHSVSQASCTTITISANPDYPPYQWVHQGEFYGASIDLTREIFAELGVEVNFVDAGPWSRVLRLAQDNRLDMVLSLKKTPQLEQTLIYTKRPIFPNRVSVFARSDAAFSFRQWADLKGRHGGRALGVGIGDGFDQFAYDHLWLEDVTQSELNMRKLLAGRIDYYIEAYYPGLADVYLAKKEETIRPFDHPLVDGYLYAAFAKGSPCRRYIREVSEGYGQGIDAGTADGALRSALFDWLVQNQETLMDDGQDP